nr:uncharacterized protein I303_03679 [Kwoniella dejecticola CBS 10117]OBR85964.1 hypothetical protein I303_03679 [Kwoniella dejecticola CBS 10117]
MDVCRKFIQMGRTRSLRYALRPGGKKYDPATGKEQKRTGKVYDQGKLDGANIYENYLDECWSDKVYKKAWDDWKEGKETEYVKVPGVDEVIGNRERSVDMDDGRPADRQPRKEGGETEGEAKIRRTRY